jgi:hypothetical protein
MRHRIQSLSIEPAGAVLTDENAPGFAELLLRLADEANAAEQQLWEVVERLANAGDVERIREVARRARREAAADILAGLDSGGTKAA